MLNQRFLDFIEKNNLIEKKSNIILSISGGVDSIVMLDLFNKLNFNFAIAHCNFKLRGKESELDCKFVEKISNRLKRKFYYFEFDTLNYSKQKKISIQMAARELRYKWLYELLEKYKFKNIATAHHINDNLETVFLNLIKGTGISGLRGILPKNKKIIRPLLFAIKDELIEYAKNNNLEWREDSSNKKNDYNRNKIRNVIVPEFKKINPNLEQTFSRNFDKFYQTELILKQKINEFKNQNLKENDELTIINIYSLKKEAYSSLILGELLKPFEFNYFQIKDIIEKEHSRGTRFLSNSHELTISENQILIKPLVKKSIEVYEVKDKDKYLNLKHGSLSFKTIDKKDFILKKETNISLLDKSKLKFPLIIRKWQKGDKFQPLGMKNMKKISDFFIDNKINIFDKEKIYLIISNNDIVAIIGYRINEKYKITMSTQEIYEISFIK
ncbi:MAG: tRNA lysidine(34) synthetase TilS [Bacteroidetes bacterium]|nr:tRNA lysidine(34) synthetase TilS [Bacteroidota bacterium]